MISIVVASKLNCLIGIISSDNMDQYIIYIW